MVKGFGALSPRPREVLAGRMLRRSVMRHFQSMRDPRVERTKRHNLMAVITIAVLAIA